MEEEISNKSSRATNYSQGDISSTSQLSQNLAINLRDRLKMFDTKLASMIGRSSKASELYTLISKAEKLIQEFHQLVGFMYLETLTDHVEGNRDALQDIFEGFQDFFIELKIAQTREQLITWMRKGIKKLEVTCKKQFKYKPICREIDILIEQIEQIMQEQLLFKFLLGHFDFKIARYTKGSNKTKYNYWQTFLKYLKSKKINLGQPLNNQIHDILLQECSIIATYDGSKPISGTFLHREKFFHPFNIPYKVEVPFTANLPFIYETQLKGSKKYQGSKQVNRCIVPIENPYLHISAMFGLRDTCYFCCRDPIEVRFTGLVQYNIPFEKAGTAAFQKTQVLEMRAMFTKVKEETLVIPFRQVVNVKKDFETTCKDHHRCSCKELAEIAVSAREAYFDISYYIDLLAFQGKMAEMLNAGLDSSEGTLKTVKRPQIGNWKAKFIGPSETPNGETPTPEGEEQTPTPEGEEQTPTPGQEKTPKAQSQKNQAKKHSDERHSIYTQIKLKSKGLIEIFNLPEYNILNQSLTVADLSQMIHNQLSEDSHIMVPFHQATIIQVRQKFQHKVHYQGNEYYSGSLQHQDEVIYEENYEYHTDLPYAGNVKSLNCHEDCWFCGVKQIDVPYQGTVHLCRKGVASGIIPFNQTKKWDAHVPFNQTITFNEIAEKKLQVDYNDKCDAVCKKNSRVGFGHHSCTSCALWQHFIQAFMDLLEVKEILKANISKNHTLLTHIITNSLE